MKNFHNPIHLLFYKTSSHTYYEQSIIQFLLFMIHYQIIPDWLRIVFFCGVPTEITEQFSVPIRFPTSVCWAKTIEKGQRKDGQQIFRSVYMDIQWLWWANKDSLKYQTMTLTGKVLCISFPFFSEKEPHKKELLQSHNKENDRE